MHTAVEAQAWSDKEFTEFLLQGSWSGEADDNIAGEKLSADLIKRVVANYRANPSDHRAQSELGLLPLTMGVAEWGVADSVGLPRDPAGKDWASDTGKNSGKHLMSYAVGGICVHLSCSL